jgi:hypothetical protein
MMSPGTIPFGGDALALAVADDAGFRRGQRHQRAHRALGAGLLHESKQGIEDHDCHDDDGFVGKRRFARILQQPFDRRDHGRDQENDHQEILELLEQPPPPRRLRRALQAVGAVSLQPRFCLRG